MIVFYIVCFIAALILGYIGYRLIAFRFERGKHAKIQYSRVKHLDQELSKGAMIDGRELEKLVKDNSSRVYTYEILKRYTKTDLFPVEYCTIEMAAEGYLVNWLEFPTELNKVPDEIEFVEHASFKINGEFAQYCIFKFKTHEPHWAAKNGWSFGVVGPYLKDSKAYDFPIATFSRMLSGNDKITPYGEAKWVHENITLKNKSILQGILKVEKLKT